MSANWFDGGQEWCFCQQMCADNIVLFDLLVKSRRITEMRVGFISSVRTWRDFPFLLDHFWHFLSRSRTSFNPRNNVIPPFTINWWWSEIRGHRAPVLKLSCSVKGSFTATAIKWVPSDGVCKIQCYYQIWAWLTKTAVIIIHISWQIWGLLSSILAGKKERTCKITRGSRAFRSKVLDSNEEEANRHHHAPCP